jgi:hypothetical protein
VARIFLSHARPDRPAALRLATALRTAGHDTWLGGLTFDVGPETNQLGSGCAEVCRYQRYFNKSRPHQASSNAYQRGP